MAINPQPQKMSVEEYFQLDADPSARYEYIDGYAIVMSGGTVGHARIARNFEHELSRHLPPGPCQTHILEVKVLIPTYTNYFLPDVAMSCDSADNDIQAQALRSPSLIVEVLSHSTEAKDRGYKFLCYQTLPSLQEYVLVSSRFQFVEIYRRQSDESWSYHTYRPDALIELQSLDIQLTFADIYHQVPVPAKPNLVKELQEEYLYS